MKWPWVSRGTYDRHTQVLIDAQASLIAQNDWLRSQHEQLLEKYHALKVQGATTPEQAPTLDRKPHDPVLEAITAKAGSDRRLRSIMSREAMQQRALGMPDEEIIQQIEQGVTADEDGIPA